MRIAVFGATGPSGMCVVCDAVARRHDVVALVRNVPKFDAFVKTLEVPEGVSVSAKQVDIFDPDSLTPALSDGIDAVVSTLGATAFADYWSCSMYHRSMVSIVKAMGRVGLRRVVMMSTWCSNNEKGNPWAIEWLFKPLVIGAICRDIYRAESYLADLPVTAQIEYTVVRAPGLKDGPAVEAPVESVEGGQWVPGCGHAMPRANIAQFILNCLDKPETIRKIFAIGMKK